MLWLLEARLDSTCHSHLLCALREVFVCFFVDFLVTVSHNENNLNSIGM